MSITRRPPRLGPAGVVIAASLVLAACIGDADADLASIQEPPEESVVSATSAPSTSPTTSSTSTTSPPPPATIAPPDGTTTTAAAPTTTIARPQPTAPRCRPSDGGDGLAWEPSDAVATVEIRPAGEAAPGLRIAEYPVPDDLGAPWSQWGQGAVLPDGRFISAVGDHRGTDGRSYVYVLDPSSGQLTQEIDVQAAAGHVTGTTGFGKVHAPVVTGPCGELYVATYWGSRRTVVYDDDYRGDVLLRVDPYDETVTNLGVIHPEHGVASMAISPDGTLLYVEAARPEPAGSGSLVVIDLTSGDVVFEDDDDRHVGYRSIAVTEDGAAYVAWENGLLARYDPETNRLEPLDASVPGGGRLRWATPPLPDGSIVAVTNGPDHFFKIDSSGELVDLGPAPGYVTSLASTPDGSTVYFAPGAHGADDVGGTIWRLDPETGRQDVVLDVAALVDDLLDVRVRGSYNIALDPVANRLFVGFNAGDETTDVDSNFGRVFVAVVDLPGPAPVAAASLVCWSAPVKPSEGGMPAFSDGTEAFGLVDPLLGMRGHAVALGDTDGDDWLDLVVGTFATANPEVYLERGARQASPDTALIGGPDGFTPDSALPDAFGRSSGAALVDLDNDGDPELALSRNVRDDSEQAVNAVYQRDADGWQIVDSGLDPTLAGRSIGVLDVDRDGLLDLLIAEDRYTGGSSELYLNQGELRFARAGTDVGWPADVEGFGVATGDLNGDGWTDAFVAGSNRMFVTGPDGLSEVNRGAFETEVFGNEDIVTGADIGDLDGDGRPDLVIGQHYNSTVDDDTEVPVRVFLNTTTQPGATPSFAEVTDQVGSVPLPTKAPHVQIADVDNDGRPDIVTSASADGGDRPAVLMSVGDGDLAFASPTGLGAEQYWVATPTADIDRDGRLDIARHRVGARPPLTPVPQRDAGWSLARGVARRRRSRRTRRGREGRDLRAGPSRGRRRSAGVSGDRRDHGIHRRRRANCPLRVGRPGRGRRRRHDAERPSADIRSRRRSTPAVPLGLSLTGASARPTDASALRPDRQAAASITLGATSDPIRLTMVPAPKRSQMVRISRMWSSTSSATAATGSSNTRPSTSYSPAAAACATRSTVPVQSSQPWMRSRRIASVTPGRSTTIAVVVPPWLTSPNQARRHTSHRSSGHSRMTGATSSPSMAC